MTLGDSIAIASVFFSTALVILKLLSRNKIVDDTSCRRQTDVKIGKMEVAISHIEQDLCEVKGSISDIHKRLDMIGVNK